MNALSQNTKITASDINTLISECNNKLSLSGGTLTGSLYFGAVGSIGISDNADYRTLWINRNSGNAIGIFDTDSPNHPGALFLRTNDGSRGTDLWLFPDGTAKIAGSDILTSAGGTMTGYIKHNVGDILSNIADNQWTSIKGGSGHNKGAAVTLYGQDYNDGQAELIAYKDGVGSQK